MGENYGQNNMVNPACVAPLRDQAIERWQAEVEAAEIDLPAAKKRARQIVADARKRLHEAYAGHELAQVPLAVWTQGTHGKLPNPARLSRTSREQPPQAPIQDQGQDRSSDRRGGR